MKYTKYLVFIVLLMFFYVNEISAETCFYQIDAVALEYNSATNKITIRQREDKTKIIFDGEKLLNKNESISADNYTGLPVAQITTECPNYIVYRRKHRAVWADSDGIFGFDNLNDAQRFANASKETENMYAWTSPQVDKTREEFESDITTNAETYASNHRKSGANFNANANYGSNGVETSDEIMSCSELFDQSIIDLLNDILKYPRYIVPGIILVLGTIDLFRAVIASKEDEMRKAQKTFIKRVIIGVCVFLVPVFMNAIIWLANIAWQGLGYSTCGL